MSKHSLAMPDQTPEEWEFCQPIEAYLDLIYPGHYWALRADFRGGVLHVYNLRFSGKWGFLILLKTVCNDPNLKCIKMAAGEMLERYRQSRGGFSEDQRSVVPVDRLGNYKADM